MADLTQLELPNGVTYNLKDASAITGSGTSEYLTKFNGANTVTNGPALGSDTTKFLRNDGTWEVPPKGGEIIGTASGAIATFETNMADVLQSVKCEINATGGNGTPDSPNLINGYSSANITRCGKNLFTYDLPIHEGYWSANAFVGSDNVVPLSNATQWTNIRMKVPEGENITLSGFQAESGVYGAFLGSDNPTDIISTFLNWQTNRTMTVPNGAKYIGLCFKNLNTEYVNYPNAQLELGNTATAYEAYNGQTYTVNFGQTVYGGVLDVTRGKLTVEYAKKTMSGGDVFGGSNPGRNAQLTISDMKSGEGYSDNNVKCSALVKTNLFEEGVTAIRVGANNNTVYLYNMNLLDLTIVDSATLNTYLSNNPIEFTYELATPFDIDLTPAQIEALLGINNVWHDGNGDTEVKYYTDVASDIKTFIEDVVVLDGLSDVEITNPTLDQVLKYNGNTWVNGTSTGGSGNKIFTTEPTPPYSIGDLWLVEDNNISVCVTARASGSFDSDDWGSAIETLSAEELQNTIASAIAGAVTVVTGNSESGGNVIWRMDSNNVPYELLITDSPDNITASTARIYRWDANGLRYSSTGYNGTYTTLINSSGQIPAQYLTGAINAGLVAIQNFTASMIHGGVLSRGRANNQDGTIELYDANGTLIAEVTNLGFKYYGPGTGSDRPYYLINTNGFVGYTKIDDVWTQTVKVAFDEFRMIKGYVRDELDIGSMIKIIPMTSGNNSGIAFVAST